MEIRPEYQDPTTFLPPSTPTQPPAISINPRHQVRFRHPHYPDSSNVLLTLFAPDYPDGGIDYGMVHAACGVISGNRWDGWFTTRDKASASTTTTTTTTDTADRTDGVALNLTYGDLLREQEYYFHLPGSSFEFPYAIVPTFREWTFPHDNLHPFWRTSTSTTTNHTPSAQTRFGAASSLSAAVVSRDLSCRMSGFVEGTQAAHLCPRSEEAWFHRNEMSQYNLNPLLVATSPMEDTANALLLRQDLHTHFDAHKFVFVPKRRRGGQGSSNMREEDEREERQEEEETMLVTHMLSVSRELGLLNHNVCLKPIPDVDRAFLFARFAWSIYTLLAGFLRAGVERRLIGTTICATAGVPRRLNAEECRRFLVGPKSRGQSPIKRSRRVSADEEDDLEVYIEDERQPRKESRRRSWEMSAKEGHIEYHQRPKKVPAKKSWRIPADEEVVSDAYTRNCPPPRKDSKKRSWMESAEKICIEDDQWSMRDFTTGSQREFAVEGDEDIWRDMQQVQTLTRRARSESDTNENASDHQHKRQKRITLSLGASQSTHSADEVATPLPPPPVLNGPALLREQWLEQERARSDPYQSWEGEEAWARDVRCGEKVMGPEEARRLYEFMGHEIQEEDMYRGEVDKG